MSAKSKNSTEDKALDRPFDKAILSKAKTIADRYKIVLEFEEGQWYGRGLEIATAFGDGKTPQAAVSSTREALVAAVAYLLETHRKPPSPSREGRRTVQVNVRMTHEEKAVLESRAKAKGFRGVSDFIRTSVLTEE